MAKKKVVAEADKDLTPNQIRILEALNRKPMTRNELKEKLDMQRGFSKLIGASTLDVEDPNSLEGRGYVKSERVEKDSGAQGPLEHSITVTGKKALASVDKPVKESKKKAAPAKAKTVKGKGKKKASAAA